MGDERTKLIKLADIVEEGFFVEDESDLAASEEARQAIKSAKDKYNAALAKAQQSQFDNQFTEVACGVCGASKPTCCACSSPPAEPIHEFNYKSDYHDQCLGIPGSEPKYVCRWCGLVKEQS